MKIKSGHFTSLEAGFTLIELLVVISIIAILAAMLLPTIAAVKVKAQKKQAETEMYNLKAAISHYDDAYSRLPATTNVDTTFGYTAALPAPAGAIPKTISTNSEIMAILLNENRFVNTDYAKNPQRTIFFETKRFASTERAGISTIDWQLRDPWGNPYLITLDLDYDGKCYDALYSNHLVSRSSGGIGYNGLINAEDSTGTSDRFSYSGEVMIWSLGPDGKAELGPANAGLNKDNVIGF